MRAGVVHDRPDTPVDGGLAIFCPACPQMDINIPPETEWKADDRYERTIGLAAIIDGTELGQNTLPATAHR
jgi:hypothetical protein